MRCLSVSLIWNMKFDFFPLSIHSHLTPLPTSRQPDVVTCSASGAPFSFKTVEEWSGARATLIMVTLVCFAEESED